MRRAWLKRRLAMDVEGECEWRLATACRSLSLSCCNIDIVLTPANSQNTSINRQRLVLDPSISVPVRKQTCIAKLYTCTGMSRSCAMTVQCPCRGLRPTDTAQNSTKRIVTMAKTKPKTSILSLRREFSVVWLIMCRELLCTLLTYYQGTVYHLCFAKAKALLQPKAPRTASHHIAA
ncbi:hypothetical protein EJ05DRAFT_92696 [Pseudovirgaria hyperparasitica]|uniref:Uncharacterized protein n=1 Tax=Pseudovirgaria hyperparasitica TaxID=470096 RepID=A0A6A6W2J7_9PEZI|nr:uncharacterized protein EJ05DRAFT_92696 [Pseudovirgaria hyperparasitica]KAF2756180.1 hypothetical protein EJ05DRAFT_92696 [Pseudovirgaria hyperparasitica]